MASKHITAISEAELDAVAAGDNSINFVGVFAAVQANASVQTSANLLTLLSGNQIAVQANNASVG